MKTKKHAVIIALAMCLICSVSKAQESLQDSQQLDVSGLADQIRAKREVNRQKKAVKLRKAIEDNDTKAAKRMLKSGKAGRWVLKEKTGAEGATALMVAAGEGNITLVRELLKKRAVEKDAVDNDHWTAVTYAVNSGHTEIVKLLLEYDGMPHYGTDLSRAAVIGYTEIVKVLLDKGYYTDSQGKNGWTALMWAAKEGHTEIVKLLLEKGAKSRYKNDDGNTALILAAWYGHTDTVKVLLENGADTNIQNGYGNTALILAAYNKDVDTVELLLKNGANPNIQDKIGYTALTWAASRGYVDTAKVLLENGADPNIKTESGDTALLKAAYNEDVDTVE
ncbi:MAG: ankyrin repeat domain-containing protein, partial [Elusimicrobiota bacterium]|nr:ankyrin repeat domain-containing protein [Elusimicrobiota bacterium]